MNLAASMVRALRKATGSSLPGRASSTCRRSSRSGGRGHQADAAARPGRRCWSSGSSTRRREARDGAGQAAVRRRGRLRVRPQRARPRHHRQPRLPRFMPYLAALFFFMLVNNLFAQHPVHPVPDVLPGRHGLRPGRGVAGSSTTTSASASTGSSATSSADGAVRGAARRSCRCSSRWSSSPTSCVRPITLALRLFANMFAGHILLVLFSTGGLYLLTSRACARPWPARSPGCSRSLVAFLEVLVQFLQAYVFVLLNAMYISGALADEH